MNKTTSKLLGIFLIIFLNGSLFSIMHWKNNIAMLTIGGLGASVLMLVRFWLKEPKLKSDYLKYPAFSLFFIGRVLFINHLYLNNIISLSSIALVLIWIIWYLIENKFKIPNNDALMGTISIGMLIIASLFKIMHWVGGDFLILVSFALLVVWVGYRFVVKAS